jgi:hypothetical protein
VGEVVVDEVMVQGPSRVFISVMSWLGHRHMGSRTLPIQAIMTLYRTDTSYFLMLDG